MKEPLALLSEPQRGEKPGFGADKMKGLIYGGSAVVVVLEKFSHSCCQEPGFFAQNFQNVYETQFRND